MTRSCDECTVCCVFLGIPNLTEWFKPCQYLRKTTGAHNCTRYGKNQPKGCEEFRCGWLRGAGELQDRPDKSGVLITVSRDGKEKSQGFILEGGAQETLDRMCKDLKLQSIATVNELDDIG